MNIISSCLLFRPEFSGERMEGGGQEGARTQLELKNCVLYFNLFVAV